MYHTVSGDPRTFWVVSPAAVSCCCALVSPRMTDPKFAVSLTPASFLCSWQGIVTTAERNSCRRAPASLAHHRPGSTLPPLLGKAIGSPVHGHLAGKVDGNALFLAWTVSLLLKSEIVVITLF